jgi:hypothetical protein
MGEPFRHLITKNISWTIINENSDVSMRIKRAELHVMQKTICRVLHEQLLYLYNRIWIIIFWISTHGNT